MKKQYLRYLILFILMVLLAVGICCLVKALENDGSIESTVTIDGDEVAIEISIADKEEDNPEEIDVTQQEIDNSIQEHPIFNFSDIPPYSKDAYIVVNDNVPFFTEEDMVTTSYESYADLDSLGRCGVCVASVGTDIMPTEERDSIGNVKPSGWNQAKYPEVVSGSYLYNRCHLIGHQLTGENDNDKNLITGTRYINIEGMLPFENMVADYVKETGNHVIYRVTPIFENDNLVASGVLMEAKSVEDDGEDILFCVYCYNVQPGIVIDYTDGSSRLKEME